jgi:hypothetical protein
MLYALDSDGRVHFWRVDNLDPKILYGLKASPICYLCFMLLKFRYARCSDLLLIAAGTTFAIFHGASMPILALIFGKMTNTLITQVCEPLI